MSEQCVEQEAEADGESGDQCSADRFEPWRRQQRCSVAQETLLQSCSCGLLSIPDRDPRGPR